MGDSFFAHAVADANDAMGKATSEALGEDEEPPPETGGGFKTQAMQRIKTARYLVAPGGKSAEKAGFWRTNVCDGRTKCAENAAQAPRGNDVSKRRDFSCDRYRNAPY